MSWCSKNASKRRRSCRRPSLCESHCRWRMLVCRLVTATGSSPSASANSSICVGLNPPDTAR